jgi:hypothetical protein
MASVKRVRVRGSRRYPRHPDQLRDEIYEASRNGYVAPPLFHWRATFRFKDGGWRMQRYPATTYEDAKARAQAIVTLRRWEMDACWLIRE